MKYFVFFSKHYNAIARRYQIADVEAFARAARRYECKLQRLATLAASDSRFSNVAEKRFSVVSETAAKSLAKRCRFSRKFEREVFFNRDPRGHAIKLHGDGIAASYIIRDWGGDGLLAPDRD